jgi:hypothetical protein
MSAFLQAVESEIAALKRELMAHPAYVKMTELNRVRDLYRAAENAPTATTAIQPKANEGERKKNAPPMAGKSLEAVNAVIEVLRSHGKPMRTAELLPHIVERGIIFNGNAPQNILSSLLSRSDDVVSKGGHVGWALASWDSEEGTSAASVSPSSDVQPHSGPVEPGQEVAHDNIA